jgi:hypothetical protein
MKKTAILLLLSIIAVNAGAQDMHDAIRYGTNDYKGSARSMGMGNAMTAVGGDIGSITFNPAGSAISNFSQLTLSPGFSIASSKAYYSPVAGSGNSYRRTDSYSKMTMPNFGFILNYNTGESGLKNVSFSIVGNQTNNFLKTISSGATNGKTSILGAMAYGATGYESSVLNSNDSYYDGYTPWQSILAYQSGMIATYSANTSQYIGATEKLFSDNTISIAGPLSQKYGQRSSGNKYDIVFNLGFNINDILYLGANLGVTSLDYTYDNYFKEYAIDPSDFGVEFSGGAITNFHSTRYRYAYDANGTGIYGKIGFILTPFYGLRIGAAIQTPTTIEITEHWSSAADTYYTDSQYDASAQTPRGEYTYKLRTPYRANAGIAYTFGKFGLISADYEICDYSTMKFMEKDSGDNTSFDNVNDNIKDYTRISRMLRLGAEIRIVPEFAVRGGYDMSTSPEKNIGTKKKAFSFGFGYDSKGPFFTDIALKHTKYANEYIAPYADYILDKSNNVVTYSPEILNKSSLWDVVWTVGLRF